MAHSRTLALALGALIGAAAASAQPAPIDRLPTTTLDATPPSARVRGSAGAMTVQQAPCRVVPLDQVRQRIVNLAVQEWAFFGFPIVDQTTPDAVDAVPRARRGRSRLSPEESARVAASIAGYWSVTPEGSWILGEQNRVWTGPTGVAARWRYPWSAAFVSWIMCEGGLGEDSLFRRAVAHHVYIDQAIQARTSAASTAVFAAYDIGDAPIVPGDLLCSSRRPVYHSIAERRRQMGGGARSHCDIVVKLDDLHNRILAIGGNVRGTVSLKLLPADGALRPISGERPIFAHLKLQAASIEADALDRTPTVRELRCSGQLGGGRTAVASLLTVQPSNRSC